MAPGNGCQCKNNVNQRAVVFAQVEPIAEAAAKMFHDRLFTIDPSAAGHSS